MTTEQQLAYWQTRCLAAEKCLEVSPCDPDITTEQIAAHQEWNRCKDLGIEPSATISLVLLQRFANMILPAALQYEACGSIRSYLIKYIDIAKASVKKEYFNPKDLTMAPK